MNPDDQQPPQPTPNQYPTSPSYGPPGQPVVVSGGARPAGNRPTKPNKILLMSVIGGSVGLLLVIGLVVLVAGGSKTPAPKTSTAPKTTQSVDAAAATPTNIQVINDSVSQDISSLNDEQDFPATKLDDKALGL